MFDSFRGKLRMFQGLCDSSEFCSVPLLQKRIKTKRKRNLRWSKPPWQPTITSVRLGSKSSVSLTFIQKASPGPLAASKSTRALSAIHLKCAPCALGLHLRWESVRNWWISHSALTRSRSPAPLCGAVHLVHTLSSTQRRHYSLKS